MSKKKKIIISVIAAVLVLVTILGVVGAVISRQNEIKKAQEEYEQAQNANNNQDILLRMTMKQTANGYSNVKNF